MWRQIVIGLIAGVAFLVLDGVLNANPLAQWLYAAYGLALVQALLVVGLIALLLPLPHSERNLMR